MKIHFIGIGGIGVSALAQYYLQKGHEISGSDLAASEITDFFSKKGVKIMIGNKAENMSADFDLVIYSPAVKPENPEYVVAKKLGIKTQSYPQVLGELTKEFTTIAISGSHGKSTTTAMTALILIKAGIDPTVIVGTKLKEFSAEGGSPPKDGQAASGGGNNFRMGKSKYLVIEACEYDGSFLNYSPKIIAITNVDKEHLDYFKTFANVKKAFKDFVKKLPKGGHLVESKNYSLNSVDGKKLKKILKIPGDHNVSNALTALAVARILGVKDTISFKSLSEYKGSWRRFELKESAVGNKKITVISDYGHHPTEVVATLKATREKFPKKKIWCIFQPHQHQRTYYLFKDFVALFKKVKIDNIIITDIYDVAGRETKKINEEVSSQLLVKKIAKKNVKYMNMENAEIFVKENIKSGEVIIIMGAGDIYKLFDKF